MTNEKTIKDLRISIDETMASIRAIKGDTYADVLDFLNHGVQMTKMIAASSVELPEVPRDLLRYEVGHTLALASELLFRAYGYTKEQEKEMMEWVMQISDRIDNTMLPKEE